MNWVTESGNDKDSAFADPGFVDAARNNFQLAPGSPAIGTGMPLPLSQTGLFDFAGNSRTTGGRIDIGALQK